ncbi:16S rRNA (cytosine(1402)-N(4))-methyltransferase RsmH [Candidatus Gracilibacteria bacterium]|nr:16S rRNA (cytosine(1402)-N(4))-methyltransferase RsmH [Candidatus Gracilibacteria bacterium]
MFEHDPVLLEEIESYFVSQKPKKYVIDATLGLGGHARMMLSHMSKDDIFIGIDRDKVNQEIARNNLEQSQNNGTRVQLYHSSFSDLDDILQKSGVPTIDFILYDLGVSSAHYDDGERGFSLRFDAPLDMRFDRTKGKTASDLIRELDSRELMKIFFLYADEKKAFFIAEAIVKARKISPINTTFELLKIIEDASFDKKSPIRVFQALRIAVNEEFKHIEKSLTSAINHLNIGGRIAVITFHSIEDRIVKQFFSTYTEPVCDEVTGRIITPPRLKKVTKKPIEPTEIEIHTNPRSRSAKLRILERIT